VLIKYIYILYLVTNLGIVSLSYWALDGLTVNWARPLRLLAFKTPAPAVVALRTRNPWVVARFCLLG